MAPIFAATSTGSVSNADDCVSTEDNSPVNHSAKLQPTVFAHLLMDGQSANNCFLYRLP
jgi:hypothetical protein